MTTRLAVLIGLVLVAACDNPRRPPVTDPPTRAPLECELTVRRHGTQLGLSFALSNRADQPHTVRYVHPFLQFELRVSADGRDLTVEQPDLEVPSQPRELAIAAGGRASLDTPIRLRFATDAADDDPMVWTIAGPPIAVELHARLTIDGETIAPCVARIDPAATP